MGRATHVSVFTPAGLELHRNAHLLGQGSGRTARVEGETGGFSRPVRKRGHQARSGSREVCFPQRSGHECIIGVRKYAVVGVRGIGDGGVCVGAGFAGCWSCFAESNISAQDQHGLGTSRHGAVGVMIPRRLDSTIASIFSWHNGAVHFLEETFDCRVSSCPRRCRFSLFPPVYSENDVKLHRTGVFARLECIATVGIELAPLRSEHKAIHPYLLWHPEHRRLLLIDRCYNGYLPSDRAVGLTSPTMSSHFLSLPMTLVAPSFR